MRLSDSTPRMKHAWAPAVLAVLASTGLGASVATEFASRPDIRKAELTREEAAQQYAANLTRLLETRIVPGLKRGVLNLATRRPKSLVVEVTDDPSPYEIGAKIGRDGAVTVRLSLGYLTMHDAALDAVGLAAALDRTQVVRSYLRYQLLMARGNDARSVRGQARRPVLTFAEFMRIDPNKAQSVFAQTNWREWRRRAEVDSLGWAISYLLVRADSTLGGLSSVLPDSAGAARLAAASEFFPAPPFATAFELVEVVKSRSASPDERKQVCRAAEFMAAGIRAARANSHWSGRLKQDTTLRHRIELIDSEVKEMRDDAHCAPGEVTVL